MAAETHAEFYSDTICTAIEGGIGYWSICREYRWDGLPPAEVFATIIEEDETVPMRIDWKVVRKGVRAILEGKVQVNSTIRGYIADAYAEKDAGYIDADAADCIVQAALLGEIRYG